MDKRHGHRRKAGVTVSRPQEGHTLQTEDETSIALDLKIMPNVGGDPFWEAIQKRITKKVETGERVAWVCPEHGLELGDRIEFRGE